jgi:hypothetical protein
MFSRFTLLAFPCVDVPEYRGRLMGNSSRAPMPPCHFEPNMDLFGRFTIIQDCFLDARVLLLRMGMYCGFINVWKYFLLIVCVYQLI